MILPGQQPSEMQSGPARIRVNLEQVRGAAQEAAAEAQRSLETAAPADADGGLKKKRSGSRES